MTATMTIVNARPMLASSWFWITAKYENAEEELSITICAKAVTHTLRVLTYTYAK